MRLVLKTAHRYGWIEAIPDLSPPYKTSGKVKHRAWFSPQEYKMLYEATRERAKNPKQERYRATCGIYMTMCSSWRIRVCARMKPEDLNTGMS